MPPVRPEPTAGQATAGPSHERLRVTAPEAPSILEGRVTRVLFRDKNALFAAVKIKPPGRAPEVSVVGEFLTVSVGDEFTFTGEWETHPKWGPQFRASYALRKLPRQPEAIAAYLSGGLFPGVGPAIARRIVGRFGEETLGILLAHPERVEEVPGIGAKKRVRLAASFQEHRRIQDLALFLQGHGVSLYLTKKIHERYGDGALAILRENPYRAGEEIPGIGFLKADAIARKIGLPADSPARIQSAVSYVLKSRCEVKGHSFLPEAALVLECLGFLNREPQDKAIESPQVTAAVTQLIAAGTLVSDGPQALYLSEVYSAEVDLARRVCALQQARGAPPARLEAALARTAAAAGITYAQGQREAIASALTSPVAVVTGGPGTGKSTVIRGVIAALLALRGDADVLLAAPTGRAAKRMAEVTGREAATIHRLLEFSPEGGVFKRHEAAPLEGDLLVVDEASMLDLPLACALLRAVPCGMQVLLVGDADQLPSVGFGNVFADLIRSQTLPVVRLSHIFRQARESRIVINAHRVNQGQMPILEKTSDCQFVEIEKSSGVAEFIRQAALTYRAAGLALDEINILSPMRKTETGVVALNKILQATLNPPSPSKREITLGEAALRIGDKVMQIRNNYDKGVFNGDIGVIQDIAQPEESDREDEDGAEEVTVNFQGNCVTYARAELDQLVLAYASTVHKAQGSEYRGVVMIPVVREHSIMLARNLLYTAITRAKERVILVGQKAAVWRAVTNAGSRMRYSRLAERLRTAAKLRPST